MYLFVKYLTKNEKTATLSAIIYMLMPYHLNDMYIRNALGEFLSYIFIPLVFLGLHKIFHKENGKWYLSIGSIGLILTHILMTLLTAFIACVYIFIYFKKLKDIEILKQLGISILCILGISAFFWMPMLETYFFTDYAVYQNGNMATIESLYKSGLSIKELLYTDTKSDATHIFEIGIPIFIMFCLSFFAFKKVLNTIFKKEYILFLILGIVCTLITIKQFPWGIFENVFQILQFKWRWLLFSNFFLSMICGINMTILIKQFNVKDMITLSMICILYTAYLIPMLPENSEITEIDKISIGEVTENKNDTIVGMGKGEYLPTKANENRKYIITRNNNASILKGFRKC